MPSLKKSRLEAVNILCDLSLILAVPLVTIFHAETTIQYNGYYAEFKNLYNSIYGLLLTTP